MTALPNTVIQTIQAFEDHRQTRGGAYEYWYAGVASDPKKRLFQDHNVSEPFGQWIYQDVFSDAAARQVEDYFLARGCKGGPGGGDSGTRYAYLYKVTSQTKE